MKKLMNILFLSCRRAAELVDKRIHTGISVPEKMRLKMHTMMCNACFNYSKQSQLIDDAIKCKFEDCNENHKIDSPEGLKQHIFEKIVE